MSEEVFVYEVSRDSFNTSVILKSHSMPVLVEFMGVWSEPCVMMSDHLAAMATEFAGEFVFARVDVDEQPELKEEYAVTNVPTLKLFRDGEVIRTEEGQLQSDELRALLKAQGVYRQSDEMRLQARQMHVAGNTVDAIKLMTQAIQQDPSNTRVAMDMVQIFLDIGEDEQAKGLFNRLPEPDRLSDMGKSLMGQLTFRELAGNTAGKDMLLQRVADNPADVDAHFDLSICLVAEHDYIQGTEHLFKILQQEPEYKDGAAREMVIGLINMLAPNDPELAGSLRRKLGSIAG